MDFDDRQLEQQLARQRLTPPPLSLDKRMASLFAQQDPCEPVEPLAVRSASRWMLLAGAAAACLAVGVIFWFVAWPPQPAAPPLPVRVSSKDAPAPALDAALAFEPVRIEQTWSDVQPDGVVVVDGDPLRRYRRQIYQRVQLIDDERNIRIEYMVPRSDVVVVPVRYD